MPCHRVWSFPGIFLHSWNVAFLSDIILFFVLSVSPYIWANSPSVLFSRVVAVVAEDPRFANCSDLAEFAVKDNYAGTLDIEDTSSKLPLDRLGKNVKKVRSLFNLLVYAKLIRFTFIQYCRRVLVVYRYFLYFSDDSESKCSCGCWNGCWWHPRCAWIVRRWTGLRAPCLSHLLQLCPPHTETSLHLTDGQVNYIEPTDGHVCSISGHRWEKSGGKLFGIPFSAIDGLPVEQPWPPVGMENFREKNSNYSHDMASRRQ